MFLSQANCVLFLQHPCCCYATKMSLKWMPNNFLVTSVPLWCKRPWPFLPIKFCHSQSSSSNLQKPHPLFDMWPSLFMFVKGCHVHRLWQFTWGQLSVWASGHSGLHRLTLQKGVYSFRYFLLPMRIPDLQTFDLIPAFGATGPYYYSEVWGRSIRIGDLNEYTPF